MDERKRRALLLSLVGALAAVLLWWGLAGGEAEVEPLVFGVEDFESVEPGDEPGELAVEVSVEAGVERAGLGRDELPAFGVFGRVLDAGGAPLEGATVGWVLTDDGGRALRLRAEARTRADGMFAFAGRVPELPRLVLVVTHPEHAPKLVERRMVEAVERLDFGELRMTVGGSLRARVLDASGQPGAGASLSLRPVGGNPLDRLPGWRRLLPPAIADAGGRVDIAHLPAGDYRATVTASAALRGGPEEVVTVVDGERVELGDIQLAAGYRLVGLVFGPDGEPRAEAEIRVSGASGEVGPALREFARSEADGSFEVDHLPERGLRVQVLAEGCLSWSREPIRPAGAEPLRVELEAGLSLRGLVKDAVSGEPLEDFHFVVREVDPRIHDPQAPMSAAPEGALRSEHYPDGRFVEEGLDLGSYLVEVRAPGFVPTRSAVAELRRGGAGPELVIAVERGLRITGSVVDAVDGRPIAGARVELRVPAPEAEQQLVALPGAEQRSHEPFLGATVSDSRGAFRFEGQAAGRRVLIAKRDGYVPARSEPFEAGRDREAPALEMSPPASLAGQVDGLAGANGSVQVLLYGGPDRLWTARVDGEGRYLFAELPPGGYLLRACEGDLRDYLASRIRPQCGRGGLPRIADVTLGSGESLIRDLRVDPPALGSVVGTVRRGGTPVSGCRVTLRPALPPTPGGPRFDPRHRSVTTDNEGGYKVIGVAAGEYSLQVDGIEAAPARPLVQVFEGSERRRDIELEPSGERR